MDHQQQQHQLLTQLLLVQLQVHYLAQGKEYLLPTISYHATGSRWTHKQEALLAP